MSQRRVWWLESPHLEVDEVQAAAVIDEDRGAPVASLGEFALHLREEYDFG